MIGIFDSGVGGLSVLLEAVRRLPGERYTYFSDNAFCPYGGRDSEFIKGRARTVTRELLSHGADAVIVACNTATTVAVASLREEFPVPFIGLEPAVKPAAALTKSGTIGVLATAATLGSAKYRATRDGLPSAVTVVESVGSGFVELVESGVLNGTEAENVVRPVIEPMLAKGVDAIALGCTHYPFLRNLIESLAPGVTVIDPAPSVARHLEDVLGKKGLLRADACGFPDVTLLSSGDSANLERTYNTLVLPELSSKQI